MYENNCVTYGLIESFDEVVKESSLLCSLVEARICECRDWDIQDICTKPSHRKDYEYFKTLFCCIIQTEVYYAHPETGDLLYSNFRVPRSLLEIYLVKLAYERLRIQNGEK